jgi:hypothetical protein
VCSREISGSPDDSIVKELLSTYLVLPFGSAGQFYEGLEKMTGKEMRDDLQFLKKEVEKHTRRFDLNQLAELFCGRHSWDNRLVVNYLQLRACDIARYGVKVADRTFPQPTIKNVMPEGVAKMVDWMASILQNITRQEEEKEDMERLAKHAKYKEVLQENIKKKFFWPVIPMPDIHLRDLTYNEIEALKDACLKELYRTDKRDWDVKAVLKVIDEFVEFCTLLPKPENLLKTRTGQLVTHRTVSDMEAEASLELVNLDPYTAEAKLIRDGKQGEVRIKTRKLDEPLWKGKELENLMSQIKDNMERLEYVRKRSDIEREIMQRQEKWRSQIPDSKRQIPPSEEPPPTYY